MTPEPAPSPPPRPSGIDMSPEAIDARLRELEDLYELGMALKEIRWLRSPVDGSPLPETPA